LEDENDYPLELGHNKNYPIVFDYSFGLVTIPKDFLNEIWLYNKKPYFDSFLVFFYFPLMCPYILICCNFVCDLDSN
jgi:hypothetical protein